MQTAHQDTNIAIQDWQTAVEDMATSFVNCLVIYQILFDLYNVVLHLALAIFIFK
jgi:hypothetical protein